MCRASSAIDAVPWNARDYLGLRPENHVLLRKRAGGRGMATATYASILLRAHLRAVSPLPEREFGELKRSVAELGVIGRNPTSERAVRGDSGSAKRDGFHRAAMRGASTHHPKSSGGGCSRTCGQNAAEPGKAELVATRQAVSDGLAGRGGPIGPATL